MNAGNSSRPAGPGRGSPAGGPVQGSPAGRWREAPAPAGLPRELLERGHVVFRSYLTAEIMLAHVTAQALGLSSADFFGLNMVSLRGPITAGGLAQSTGLTSGAATRMIDRLETAGFVRRVHDTADRRRVLIEFVPARQAEIDAVLEPGRRRLGEIFLGYTAEQIGVLFDYFERAAPALLATLNEIQTTRPDGSR